MGEAVVRAVQLERSTSRSHEPHARLTVELAECTSLMLIARLSPAVWTQVPLLDEMADLGLLGILRAIVAPLDQRNLRESAEADPPARRWRVAFVV